MVLAPRGNLGGNAGSYPPTNLPNNPGGSSSVYIYNYFQDANNYDRLRLSWDPYNYRYCLQTEQAGAGSQQALNVAGQGGLNLDGYGSGIVFQSAGSTVATIYSGFGGFQINGRVAPGNGTNSGAGLWSGSGVPGAGMGNNGDYYFRTDTPGTANQRVYVKSGGAWVGII